MNISKVNNPVSQMVDSLFNSSLSDLMGSDFISHKPSVNIVEEDDAFNLLLAAPGYEKEDFKLEIIKDQLVVSSERKAVEVERKDQSEEDSIAQYLKREFSYQGFKRSFHLPENIERDTVDASYTDGILKVKLVKKVSLEDSPLKIEIK